MGLESEYANCKTLYVLPPAGYDTQESNVPVMVRIGRSAGKYRDDTSDVFEKLGASYLKMAVSLDDAVTECPVEVKDWDVDRQLGILFVKIPSVPTTGMTLKLWYDSTHADNTTNVGAIGSAVGQSVWTNGFAGVWHMKNSGGLVLDSTANANHGTIHGATEVDGPLGRCLSFDGIGGHVFRSGSSFNPYGGDYSVEAMCIPRGDFNNEIIISASSIGSNPIWELSYEPRLASNYLRLYSRDDAAENPVVGEGSPGIINLPTVVVVTISSTDTRIYQEGVVTGTASTPSSTFTGGTQMTIGGLYRSSLAGQFEGEIPFVALSSVARSPAWIALTNASLKDELIAFSTPGTESLSGNERMRLMPDGTLVADEFVEV